MSCPDCAHDTDHCHGTLVRHPDGSVECTDRDCVETGHERHGLALPAPEG